MTTEMTSWQPDNMQIYILICYRLHVIRLPIIYTPTYMKSHFIMLISVKYYTTDE